ncbi:hypothetical protein TGAM01_v204701 [Trichoderma gamsii]|uniref:Uncharacterized protein n=1 Tax=Trichoderma gamsii TaxID=398673 RepID=A0A2P4ZPK5_9HYPO|nr:hypothetical protein TGAM01_v204701 [Trichoderma gamsii]PON26225.1 hypothetical protein TGAM01_v204701 [Trichoderma gamsii]
MSEMSDANNDKIVVVPQRNSLPSPLTPRSRSPSPPPPDTDPAPPPAATPAVAAAIRPSRGLAAGDDAFPSIVADDENDENELPPSYEISTLPRPSDAHVHITVRSNTSASSLPSLTAGPGSINTQGYVLTAPMSHQTASSRHSGSHSHHEHNDQDPITFYGVEDPWKTGAASPTAMDAAFPSAAASAVPIVEGAAAAITKVFASRTMEAGSALPKQGTAVLSQCRQQQRHGRRGYQ